MFVFLKKRDAAAFYVSLGETNVEREHYRVQVKKGDAKYFLLPDGTRDGEYKEYWQSGGIKYKCFYSLGKLHGKKYEWTEEGALLYVQNFEKDELNGVAKYWNKEGVLVKETLFCRNKALHQKSWYNNGAQKRDGEKTWHSNGVLRHENGRTWDEQGNLLGEFSEGTGKKITWYSCSDKIKSQTEWKDGLLHGLHVVFRTDGTYMNISRYFEGKCLGTHYYKGKGCRRE
ncbi:MORN repeat-containing protein [Noumeavirus]|uniref:MORN repeat-containing protein n=1 Tax=Noumeavirus TaxID=1955558 RepID=UPI000982F4BF|nr:MORN repeat-containing protein [Noumeavirus]AQM73347.1 MORN repeat-containing protein [Noumeavirus]